MFFRKKSNTGGKKKNDAGIRIDDGDGKAKGSGSDAPKTSKTISGSFVRPDVDFVGFKYGDDKVAVSKSEVNRAYGISALERMHMAIFGLPGSGKSTIIKLLVWQNIMRNEGFMVVDPHGQLARDIMSMVPKERHEDVIYVNPASLYKFKRTVRVNPLEIKDPNERYVVVMSFISALMNLYKDSWGPRLETVLRNAANALVESPEQNRLGNISAMITDEGKRSAILDGVESSNVVHFWNEIFANQYAKDAGSSAYNKIDKILATPTVAAMFDTIKSSISIRDVIENRRMLIVDLSTGASDDIAEFLGSIFLNMMYVECKKRLDIEGEEGATQNKYFVYIDEAHMFSNATMSEMLRALRKFGVRMTLATQTINAYDPNFAKEIPGVCKTLITGRCDPNTASLLKTVMSTSVEEMQRLPSHSFALFSDEHGVHAQAVFRSRPVPFPGTRLYKWDDVAGTSVKKWGDEVSIEKYIHKQGKIPITPVEACILHMMFFDNRDWYRHEFMERVPMVFPEILQKYISGALDKLVRERYVKIQYPKTDDGDENETRKRYTIGEKAYSTYLSRAYGGRRSGGEDHMDIVFNLSKTNMNKHRYSVPDLGDRGESAPDLLIVEPEVEEKGKTDDGPGVLVYNPLKWSETKRLAVEVETNPKKHISQGITNYTKNVIEGEMDVLFICFEEGHREALEDAIRAKYPKFERCKMDVIDRNAVLRGEKEMPGTYDESFTPVKVKTIREIAAVFKKRDEGHSYYVPPEQQREQNENARKNDSQKDNPYSRNDGYDNHGVQAHVKKGKPVIVHTTDLEYKVWQGIKDGKIYRDDTKQIRRILGVGYSINQIKDAIHGLIVKGAITKSTHSHVKKIGSRDGTGDTNKRRELYVLELVYEDPVPENESKHTSDNSKPAESGHAEHGSDSNYSDTAASPSDGTINAEGRKIDIEGFNPDEYSEAELDAMMRDESQASNHLAIIRHSESSKLTEWLNDDGMASVHSRIRGEMEQRNDRDDG